MSPKPNLLPVAKAGFAFIFLFGGLSALFLIFPGAGLKSIGFILLILTLFCIFFFRDPQRSIPQDPSYILSPADGRILEISEEPAPWGDEKVKVIKIFLSIFNVHVQRSPISGKVVQIDYKQGKFLDARDPRASFVNESNSVTIEGENCKMVVKQIAGFIARRIRCFVSVGENLDKGSRLGLIQFGSQVDLFLKGNFEITCQKDEKVVGGRTILALKRI